MNRLFEDSGRVLAFGAHPDDIEVGAGGLLARLVEEGATVTMAVVSVPNNMEVRKREAEQGAATLGAKLRFVFDEKPNRVEDIPMHELVRRFDQLVADVQPDLVVTHCQNDLHWDHGLVHRATISALRRTTCDLLAFISSPEMNAHVRGYGNCFADVTKTIETKVRAISAHQSQLSHLDLDSTRDLARAMGRISGHAYAETFEVLRVRI
ncbi:MAG: PIG-L family deacetylase [Deltaproteobacteria bacterium]|nr:PIG-L family deacetylase [Deltaproteobacteria bacterium]MDQ3297946.1 PIG-L family deacetylase [Myxococcota bacterium]